jgi:hypothetical protein
MKNSQKVSKSKLRDARRLRDAGASWSVIARFLQVSAYRLRCEIEPGYRARKIEHSRAWSVQHPNEARASYRRYRKRKRMRAVEHSQYLASVPFRTDE